MKLKCCQSQEEGSGRIAYACFYFWECNFEGNAISGECNFWKCNFGRIQFRANSIRPYDDIRGKIYHLPIFGDCRKCIPKFVYMIVRCV